MNIYQATLLAQIESHVDPETGEIDIDGFMQGQENLKEKQLATVAYIKNQNSAIDAITQAIANLSERKQRMQSRVEMTKVALIESMKASGTTKLTATDSTYSVRLSAGATTAVNVFDEALVPEKFKVKKETYSISKTMIKEAILRGENVDGSLIVHNDRLLIV